MFFPVIEIACPCYIVGWWDSNPLGVSLVPFPAQIRSILFFPLWGGGIKTFFLAMYSLYPIQNLDPLLHSYTISAVCEQLVRMSYINHSHSQHFFCRPTLPCQPYEGHHLMWSLPVRAKNWRMTPIPQVVSKNLTIYPVKYY